MRRLLTILFLVGVAASAVLFAGASEEDSVRKYKIQFDNAFGLVEDGDFRVGGVTAGKTADLDVTELEKGSGQYKAVITGEITEPGFEDFRKDATCDIKPQSLIGEYYVDCQPGSSSEKLSDGATVPVEQTTSTIPQDLVNNILRRPYRERLRLIISELGTGLAGRPEDLAEVLRRAHPGLRETSRVLKILGDQNQTIEQFLADADTVIAELEANKADVVRWVVETGETAEITASRREELRESIEKFPTFLGELRPTMVELGKLADEQTPLLTDLQRAAPDLERFTEELGPFSEASRPALRSLGAAAEVGTRAFKRGVDEIEELKKLGAGSIQTGPAPDQQGFARPLRQFLQSADERRRAPDDGPQGTGGQDERGAGQRPAARPTPATRAGGQASPPSSRSGTTRSGRACRSTASTTSAISSAWASRRRRTARRTRTASRARSHRPRSTSATPGSGPTSRASTSPTRPLPQTAAALRETTPSRRGEQRGAGQPEAAPLPGQDDASKPQVTLPPQLEELLERLQPDKGGRVPLVEDLVEGLQNGLEGAPPLPDLGGESNSNPEQLLDFLLGP